VEAEEARLELTVSKNRVVEEARTEEEEFEGVEGADLACKWLEVVVLEESRV